MYFGPSVLVSSLSEMKSAIRYNYIIWISVSVCQLVCNLLNYSSLPVNISTVIGHEESCMPRLVACMGKTSRWSVGHVFGCQVAVSFL